MENIQEIIVYLIILCAAIFAGVRIIKSFIGKKSGCDGCDTNCSGCSIEEIKHNIEEVNKNKKEHLEKQS